MQNKAQILKSIDSILLILWSIFFLLFPFVISTATTENFILPKQLFLSSVTLLSLLLVGIKMAFGQQIRFRRTPLDVPVALFAFALLLSALLAVDRFDSLTAFVPTLMAVLGYYLIVNILRHEKALTLILSTIVFSAAGIGVFAIFSFLKIYPLPMTYTHIPAFTPLGSLLEQGIFLMAILPLAIQVGLPLFKGETNGKTVAYMAGALFIATGLLVTVAQLLSTQKPVILPFETGFQTAFAAISQDTGRVAQGFFFGSGYGNFPAVFTRFKQASFNTNQTLWFVPFTQSSSLILELLATTGIIGILSFFLILFRSLSKPSKKKTNPAYVSLVLLTVSMFIFPFSFESLTFFFVILALYAAFEAFKHPHNFFDIEPRLVALKKGLIVLHQTTEESNERHEYNKVLPLSALAILLLFVGTVGLYGGKFFIANLDFQQSIVAASTNNGSATYDDQVSAINIFPYQSSYYRVFSQTNIALANSIANSQPKQSSPSAQVQSTIYSLIQQGITTARNATELSPQLVANWQNLASVYRSLIGLGQNAENFSILATQQAVALDPNNPQEYISLGGIYYQLGQYDAAIRAFQQAINLKQDYTNAYYNLGHSYQQKGDIQDALAAFQVVSQLTASDPANHTKITAEIDALQKTPQQNQQTTIQPTPTPTPIPHISPAPSQGPLNINGQQSTITPIPTSTGTPTK